MKTSETGIQAVVFDLGNVIVGIDFDRVFRSWSLDSDVPEGEIREAFSVNDAYIAHERGEITTGEYFISLRASLGIQISDQQFETGWNRIFTGEMPGMRELLGRIAPEIPCYVLSNTNRSHQRRWMRDYAAILTRFRSIFVSSDLGWRKPEPEAFSLVSSVIGVPLDRILFFDDTRENTEAAGRMGMIPVEVHAVTDVEKALAAAGLIQAQRSECLADQAPATRSR